MTLQSAFAVLNQTDEKLFSRVVEILHPHLKAEGKEILVEINPRAYKCFRIVREKEILYYTTPKTVSGQKYEPFWKVYKEE